MSHGPSRPWTSMTDLVPVIETPRLILRAPRTEDAEAWLAHMADAETMRFLGGVNPPNLAWRNLTSVVGAWSIVGFSMFSVIEKARGRWIGRLGPWRPEGWPGNEIGWGLSRPYWGKGYATEGAQAAVDFAFETLGWEDCIHSIEAENLASIAVAHRLGSRRLGDARLPAPIDKTVNLYGQTRDEWRRRKNDGGAT